MSSEISCPPITFIAYLKWFIKWLVCLILINWILMTYKNLALELRFSCRIVVWGSHASFLGNTTSIYIAKQTSYALKYFVHKIMLTLNATTTYQILYSTILIKDSYLFSHKFHLSTSYVAVVGSFYHNYDSFWWRWLTVASNKSAISIFRFASFRHNKQEVN